ncbi:MAG: DUF2228 domain-containing protein [Nannocystaceae bacterium]
MATTRRETRPTTGHAGAAARAPSGREPAASGKRASKRASTRDAKAAKPKPKAKTKPKAKATPAKSGARKARAKATPAAAKTSRRARDREARDLRERLAELYPLDLPEELFTVWEIACKLSRRRPRQAFADALGITLCGPFDVLAGRLRWKQPPLPMVLHGRELCDPPELLTLAVDEEHERRWGYFFDDPGRRAPLVCRAEGRPPTLTIAGGGLLEALRDHLELRVADLEEALAEDPDAGRAYRRDLERLTRLRATLIASTAGSPREAGAAYVAAHVERRRPLRRPLAATADGVGLLAPRRTFRELELSAPRLVEEARASEPQALVEMAEEALAEGFPATSLAIAKALWTRGLDEPHAGAATSLLAASFRALKRPTLAAIAETHGRYRDLASADVLHQRRGGGERLAPAPRAKIWRIAALRGRAPRAIHLVGSTTAELEALVAAPWRSVERLTIGFAAGEGYLSAFAEILSGEAMPRLRHLTLLPGAFPRDLFVALAASPLLAERLHTLDFHPSSLPAHDRDALLRAWVGGDDLQLFPNAIGLDDSVAVYNLGILCRDLGYYLRALDLFERSIALGGDHWDYSEKGIALLELGDIDAAIDSFLMAIRKSSSYLVAWLNLAEAYRRGGLYLEASAALDNASDVAQAKKDQLSILGLRARVHVSAGEEEEAAALAREIERRAKALLRRRPNDADLHYWSAAAKVLSGDHREALEDLGEAISREPQQREDALHDDLFAALHGELATLGVEP